MEMQSMEWDQVADERADEVCRALIRLGIMTHGQITRLLDVHPMTEWRLTHRRNWDRFVEQKKISSEARRRYTVPTRISGLVRLTDSALAQWANREGLQRVENYVRSEMLGQRLNLVEVLIQMRHAGLLYDRWDLMLPQAKPSRGFAKTHEGLHAWLVRREDQNHGEVKLGLFILPTRFAGKEDMKKGYILSGTMRQVLQHSGPGRTILLATRENYPLILRLLLNKQNLSEQDAGFYLLPYESFLEHPGWFLESLVTAESVQRTSLVEECFDGQYQEVRGGHGPMYGALVKQDGVYIVIDTWVAGSIDRARQWKQDEDGYVVPNLERPQVAIPHVFVQDATMLTSLEAALHPRKKQYGKYTSCVVETEPWPDDVITPEEWPPYAQASARALVDPRAGEHSGAPLFNPDELDDENWTEEFNRMMREEGEGEPW